MNPHPHQKHTIRPEASQGGFGGLGGGKEKIVWGENFWYKKNSTISSGILLLSCKEIILDNRRYLGKHPVILHRFRF